MIRVLLAAALLLLLTPAAVHAAPQKWQVDEKQSSIGFSGKQFSGKFSGIFKNFTVDITFDEKDLPQSKVTAIIGIASVDSGDTERDTNIASVEWFDVKKFPTARFESTAFRKTGDGTFEADGTLTLKETTLSITLPFRLEIAEDDSGKKTARMEGNITLDRSKFGLGTGEWADSSIIGNDVPVTVRITAISAP